MRKSLMVAAALAAAALLAGCERKFTRDRFEMIQVGADDRFDVQKLIGEPRSTFGDSDQWYYEDEDDHYAALIYFGGDGKVDGKQWIDGNTGEFSGQNPNVSPPVEGQPRETRSDTRTIEP